MFGVPMDRIELLMKEYETIGAQIEHWDNHFWNKSNFFLAVEAALLSAIVTRLIDALIDNKPIQPIIFFLINFAVIFNLFICYVWFRTNRTNHEYQMVRFHRAIQIENDPTLAGIVQLYHFQQDMLKHPGYVKHSSSLWEIYLPFAFIFAWIVSLIVAAYESNLCTYAIIAGFTVIFAVAAITFVEKTGWPRPKREKIG
jgi:hypothetical protein